MVKLTRSQALDDWIATKCEPNGKCATALLFDSYSAFCASRGYPALTKRQFTLKLPFPPFLASGGQHERSGVRLLRENNSVVRKQQSDAIALLDSRIGDKT